MLFRGCMMGVYKCPKFEKNEWQKSTTVPFQWTFFALFGLYRTHAFIF